MYEEVAKVIEIIRPAIQADDGDIELREVDETSGVVTVELFGACVECPASTQTLKDGVERILRDRVDGVTAVRQLGVVADDDGSVTSPFALPPDGTPVTL